MLRKLRMICALSIVLGLLVSGAASRYVAAAPADQGQAGPQTFTVYNGHEIFTEPGEKSSWQANRFYPEILTINAGDSITFKHDSGVEPHTATFLGPQKFPDFILPPSGSPSGPPKLEANPQVLFKQGGSTFDGTAYANSGAIASDIPGPQEYTLTFTKPGSYEYICLVHVGALPDGTVVGMKGKLTVQAAGSALPMTPAQVDAAAKTQMQADEQAATAAEADAKKHSVSSTTGPDGKTVHHVDVGYQVPAGTIGGVLDYMRFTPKDLTVNVGDTVEWTVPTDHSFHNVLLGDEPDLFTFEPQPQGPPRAYVSAEVFGPAGSSTHTGTGIYSSGILLGPQDPPFGPSVTKYSLTFAQAGRYEYICGLHYHNAMDGHISVLTSTGGSTPGMPRTGGGDYWLMSLLAAAAILSLAGLALRRRMLSR